MAQQQAAASPPAVPATEHETEDLIPVVRDMLQQNNVLLAQNRAVLDLLHRIHSSHPSLETNNSNDNDNNNKNWRRSNSEGLDRNPQLLGDDSYQLNLSEQVTNSDIWTGILGARSIDCEDFMYSYFLGHRPPTSIDEVLSENREWTSWSYTAAFPELSRFLKQALLSNRCRAKVFLKDHTSHQDDSGLWEYHENRTRIQKFWSLIRDRPVPLSVQNQFTKDDDESLAVRSIQVVDLSPMVLTCILAATPR
jgi:hypothetical protein